MPEGYTPVGGERVASWATVAAVTVARERSIRMGTGLKTRFERIPLEILNEGKYELIDELYAPDFVEHYAQPGVPPTREGFKQVAMALRSAFPDLRYTVEDAIEAGDMIVHRLSASGTMKGDLLGIPATGTRATWSEIHIGRVANERIVEHWGLVDQLGMLVQLGVVPAPGQVPVAV
jgi:predicted ester cyclase